MTDSPLFPAKNPTTLGAKVPPQNLEAEQSVLGSILLKDKSLIGVLGS